MSNCLKDYVGIRLCANPVEEPGSGLYINSLPGLSIEMLDNSANDEQTTYLKLWSDAQDEAWEIFKIDFYNKLLDCHDVGQNCDMEALICSNKKLLVSAWRFLLGVQLMLFRKYSPRLNYFTLDDKEIDEQKNMYQVEYEEALAKGVKLLDMSLVKLPCAPKQISSVTWLP